MVGKGTYPISGTSASTPVVAGFFSLINDKRLAAKLPPLGFVNPLLYTALEEAPDAFIDITEGNNKASGCSTGFSAAAGWDPVTGVGSPNFPVLQEYAMKVAKSAVSETA